MIRSPAIWIITAMVVGFAAWLLWTSSPAPLETGMEALNGTQQGGQRFGSGRGPRSRHSDYSSPRSTRGHRGAAIRRNGSDPAAD